MNQVRRIIVTMIENKHPIIKQIYNLYDIDNFKFVNEIDKECEVINILENMWEEKEEYY